MYLDPQMQQAILLQNSGANPMMGGPGMPMGPQIDPALQRDARIMGMFSNFSQLGGGPALGNPFEQQIEGQLNNYKLMTERARAMQASKVDNPFYEYELAKQKGYFTLNEGEDDTAGFRRYTQERFKNTDTRTAGMKDADYLRTATPEQRTAYFQGKGYTTKTLPDGSVVSVSDDGTTVETLFDASTMQAGAAALAGAQTEATESTKNKWEVIEQVETRLEEDALEFESIQSGLNRGRQALSMIEEGEVDPGLVSGAILQYLGVGDERLAYFQGLTQEQLFEELANATLTPVSDADIRALAKLFASAMQSPEVAAGALKAFIDRKERGLERKAGAMRRNLKRIDDEDYRQGLEETYDTFFKYKAIRNWGAVVPGGK